MIVEKLPTSEERIDEIGQYKLDDEECKQVATYCHSSWPDRKKVPPNVRPYCHVASEVFLGPRGSGPACHISSRDMNRKYVHKSGI